MSTVNGSVREFPTTREEAWRYTPVDEIVARLSTATAATPHRHAVSRAMVDALAGVHRGVRLVFINGAYDAALSRHAALPAGLWCGPIDLYHNREAAPLAWAAVDHGSDGFLVRNHANARDGAVIVVSPGAQIDLPVHVVHLSAPEHGDTPTGPATISHPRTIVDVGDDSRLSLIETYCGLGGRAVTNASTTLRIGRRAEVQHTRVQSESQLATHVGHTRVEQAEDATLHMMSVTIGAEIARNAVDVHLDGPHARSELTGVNVTGGRQRHDTVVTVDHAASHGTSTQRFTGVVDDHGHASFSGEIIVQAHTVGTDASQTNRNLVLSKHAEADTRPWLQIFADDVRCTHGATVGRLDDDALFYLRSRGIPLALGRSMLIDAFIRDITDAITNDSLRAHVTARIAANRTMATTAHAVAPTEVLEVTP